MKMADVLRDLADKLDGIEGGTEESDRPENTAKTSDNFQHDVDDGADSGDQHAELTGVMIPPLQQKLEILKKTAGMDNAFDNNGTDELDDIKKLTGIKAVVQHETSEDNDVVG
jgi:hypothetical protein